MNSETITDTLHVPFEKIDPRQIQLSRVVGLVVAAIVGVGAAIGLLVFALSAGIDWIWYCAAGAGAVLTIFLIWIGIVWPAWEFARISWRLSETGLEIHRGVLWRHQISIPVARVQHADVAQGPLQRHFGLGRLIVHTAGTQNASIELDGLAHERAVALRDKIVSQRKSADVV